VSGRASTTGRGYSPSTAWRSCQLAQALLNGSCLGPARQTWAIWPSIPPRDNDGPRLSCSHFVRHPASFLFPLMPLPPHHPHSRQRALGQAPSPRIRPTPTRAVAIARPRERFTVYAHHRFRRRRTSRSSFRSSSCFSSPTYCPRSQTQPWDDRCSSTRVRGESILLLSFLRACRRGGHGSVCHA
jgi:hypothetical protein